MLGFGIWVILIMAVFVILYIVISHLLGGPDLPGRMTLDITTYLRIGAVSMMVAMQWIPSSVPDTFAFTVINLILVIAWISIFSKRLPQVEGEDEQL